jgi:type IV pilus assembly protein PilV
VVSARAASRRQRGATLIEVLVTIVIIAFGLLGMAGLQMRMQVSELEAYQRSQALMLLNDMSSRIATNRANAASYITGTTTPLGTNKDCAGMSSTTRVQADLKEWCQALQGASEYTGSGATLVQRGAMIGARGCVTQATDGDYVVTVAWQGMTPISAPPTSVDCGSGQYNNTGNCINDLCRRVVTTIVRIASLT